MCLMEAISENSVAVTQVTASLSDLNKRLEAFTDEIRKTLKDHEERIVDVEHNCRKEVNWQRTWNRLESLEKAEIQRAGAKPYLDRVLNFVQAVLIAAVVAVVLFFMKGGAIT